MIKHAMRLVSNILIARSRKSQIKSKLSDLHLWDLHSSTDNHLYVDGVNTVDLIQKYGSPLLVVNHKRLCKDTLEIKNTLATAPSGSMILYSYKTNCTPGILKDIHSFGIGAEVISPYELWLAEKMGIPGSKIVYNGVNKTEESMERSALLGVLSVNLDCVEEIDRVYRIGKKLDKILNVGIRLALNEKSQFGFKPNRELIGIVKDIIAKRDALNLNCVHFNVTSNARTAFTHKKTAVQALHWMSELKKETGVTIPYLDIGGGFGVPTTKNMTGIEYALYRTFGCYPSPPSLDGYQEMGSSLPETLTTIADTCSSLSLKMPMLLLEPGRYIVSRAQFLLSTVNSLKNDFNGVNFAITEAGRLSTTFPCDFEYHEVFVANKVEAEINARYHVMGRICTSADWMFKNRYMPQLQVGDIIAVMDAGAYFSSYSSNFAFPRPAIVNVKDGVDSLIRREDTFEHMIAMDCFSGME